MKLYLSRTLLCSLGGCALATICTAQAPHAKRLAPPLGAGGPTTVSGIIKQFNYDRDAEVEGFLLNNNALVHLPPRTAAHIASAVHTGDSVQITGLAQTSPAGVQTIEAQNVHDKTSGKTFEVPQPDAPAPYSGSGRIQQLNYGPGGVVDGFLFENGTLARMAPFAASNPSSVRPGATVAYSGFARNTVSGRTVVDVQSLTINGQTLIVAMAPPNRPAAPRPPLPPVPSGPAARSGGHMQAPPPPGRTDEPPPPPSPQPERP